MTKKALFFSFFALLSPFSVGWASDSPKTAVEAMQIMASPNVVFTDNNLIQSEGFGIDVVGRCRGILNIRDLRDQEKQIEKLKELLLNSDEDSEIIQLIRLAELEEVLEVAQGMIEEEAKINTGSYIVGAPSSVPVQSVIPYTGTSEDNKKESDVEPVYYHIDVPKLPSYGTSSDLTSQEDKKQNLKKVESQVLEVNLDDEDDQEEVEEEGEEEVDMEKNLSEERAKKAKKKRQENIKLLKKYAPIAAVGVVGTGLFFLWRYWRSK